MAGQWSLVDLVIPTADAPRHPTWLARGALALLVLLFAGLLIRVIVVPGSAILSVYNSDMAIPLLMANGAWRGFFDAYYYGQDRFGAWPFLLARGARQLLGFDWTPVGMQRLYMTAALLTPVPLALLARRAGLVAAAAWVFVAVTNPSLVRVYLGHAQPYAFQCLTVCGAWAVLHSLMARPERPGLRFAGLAVLGFLSTWMSPTSGPILAVLLGVQLLGRWGSVPTRELLRRAVPVGALIALGPVAERILRGRYHHAARDAFRTDFRTRVHVDQGHLLENLRAVTNTWSQDGSWGALILAGVGVGAFALITARRLRAGREAAAGGGAPAGGEALLLAASAAAVAALNFAICVAVDHVRRHDYDARYVALTHLFLAVAAALVVLAAVEALLARKPALEEGAAPLLGLALVGAAHLRMLELHPAPEQQVQEVTARALQSAQGERVVLGDYWQTYVYAALAPPGAVVGLPIEGLYLRTPFDLPRLRAAETVVVNHSEMKAFGPPEAPQALIGQYGVLLHLERAATPLEGFSLYRRADREALPATLEPAPLYRWNFCDGAKSRGTLRFESTGPVVVLVRSTGVRAGAPLPRAELAGRALPVDALPDFYRVRVPGPVTRAERLELGGLSGLEKGAPGCWAQDVFVLPEAAARAVGAG